MVHDAASNKAVVQRFVKDAWDREAGRWNIDVINEVFDVDGYFSNTWGAGLLETGQRMAPFQSALQLVELLSDDYVAEGDCVVRRTSARVRHVGEVFGIAPTQRIVKTHGVEMWRLADGKIVEHWGGAGEGWSLYRQITADPAAT